MQQQPSFLKKVTNALLLGLFGVSVLPAQHLNYLNTSKDAKTLDLKKFSANLSNIYRDSSVGWAYTIWKKGKLRYDQSGGFKITPADRLNQEGLPFLSSTRIHVASLSKTLTAFAIAQLVDQKKLNWDDRVKAYLPSYWKFHPDFENLSILDLVAMRSGLDGPLDAQSSGAASLRRLMEKGPNPAKRGKFNYQNTSYGLLRIVIGYATGYRELQPAADSLVVGIVTANLYKTFVNQSLFKPAGILPAECRMTDLEPAFQYPFPYANEPGEPTGWTGQPNLNDLSEYAGGFGWYLSAADAAKLINAAFVDKKLLSTKALTTLFTLDYPFKIRKNAFGEHFGSGGDWGHPTPNDGWRGIHAYYYCFPEDVVVTVFVNSGDSSPNVRVIRAYEQAFK